MKYQIPSIIYKISDITHQISSFRYQVSDIKVQISWFWYQWLDINVQISIISSIWCQVSYKTYHISSIRYQVTYIEYQVLDIKIHLGLFWNRKLVLKILFIKNCFFITRIIYLSLTIKKTWTMRIFGINTAMRVLTYYNIAWLKYHRS